MHHNMTRRFNCGRLTTDSMVQKEKSKFGLRLNGFTRKSQQKGRKPVKTIISQRIRTSKLQQIVKSVYQVIIILIKLVKTAK